MDISAANRLRPALWQLRWLRQFFCSFLCLHQFHLDSRKPTLTHYCRCAQFGALLFLLNSSSCLLWLDLMLFPRVYLKRLLYEGFSCQLISLLPVEPSASEVSPQKLLLISRRSLVEGWLPCHLPVRLGESPGLCLCASMLCAVHDRSDYHGTKVYASIRQKCWHTSLSGSVLSYLQYLLLFGISLQQSPAPWHFQAPTLHPWRTHLTKHSGHARTDANTHTSARPLGDASCCLSWAAIRRRK